MRAHLLAAFLLAAPLTAAAAQVPIQPIILGRWDLVVTDTAGTYPSWLEITPSGRGIFVGRWITMFAVRRFRSRKTASPRPLGRIRYLAFPNEPRR